jgi:hypothetical protein
MALLVMGSGLLCLKKGYDSGTDEPNFDGKIKFDFLKAVISTELNDLIS